MKKILYNILLALFVLLPVSVLAEGYVSVSPSSLTIEQGSSKTFTITAYNAIGDVTIKSNNTGVATVNTGEWGTGMVDEKQTKTGTINVTGNSIGTTTITLVIDAATFDGDDLSGQTKTITVNVVAKQTPAPTPTPTPTPTPKPPSNNNNNSNNNTTNNLSQNNNIKSLTVEGYNLTKTDNNNYSLTVTNDVTSINVNAEPEDSKAKVTGIGAHELKVGENNIEIIVTSESGAQNKINIKVTRKDGYYLEDLDSVLKNEKIQDADITITSDSKITKEEILKIKDSKKIIRLNYFDENKKLVYSWTINGKEIKAEKEFITSITYTSDNIKEIYKLSNYADGLYIKFNHSGDLPAGTKIKLYVGDKFENDSIVNVYHYKNNEKSLDFIIDNLKVTDGYIEFSVEHCSEYFVTMSTIGGSYKQELYPSYIFMIASIVEMIAIIILCLLYLLKFKTIKNQTAIIEPQKPIEIKKDIEELNKINVEPNTNTSNSIDFNNQIQPLQQNQNFNNINNFSNITNDSSMNNTNFEKQNNSLYEYQTLNNNENINLLNKNNIYDNKEGE